MRVRDDRRGLWVAVKGFAGGRRRPRRSGDEARCPPKDNAEDRLIRAGGGQVQADLGLHLDDAGDDLDEAQTQGVELGDSKARSLGHGGAQPPHQPLCSGVQEGAELVCRRSRARGTVSGEVGFPG